MSARPTCWPARAGTRASSGSSRRGSPSAITARPCSSRSILQTGRGTGSGRSIAGFDLLAGFDAASAHLLRHGGHRAAAGCELLATDVEAFREAFEAHAAATLTAEDLVPVRRVDAVVAGDEIGLRLAEELERLAPCGIGNPGVTLLLPAARCSDPRTMGEDGKHVRFTVAAGGASARAVAFGRSTIDCDGPLDATFTLELNEYNGSCEPRLILRDARPCEPGADHARRRARRLPRRGARRAEPGRSRTIALPRGDLSAPLRDRCGGGIAGTVGRARGIRRARARRRRRRGGPPAPSAADPRGLRAVLA